jgi:transcriptional regulator with XRE-family HTH domain
MEHHSLLQRESTPSPRLQERVKELMRLMQINQKQLSQDLSVSATTVSAYFTRKQRMKGWHSFERRLLVWCCERDVIQTLNRGSALDGYSKSVHRRCRQILEEMRFDYNLATQHDFYVPLEPPSPESDTNGWSADDTATTEVCASDEVVSVMGFTEGADPWEDFFAYYYPDFVQQ